MDGLDGILKELGQFGKYQVITYVLLFFPLIFASIGSMTYVFTTGDINYRCLVPECEENNNPKYDQPWVKDAIPYTHDGPEDHCLRYKPKYNINNNCTRDNFLSDKEMCNKFVFENDENTITKEFDLFCDENKWKRTIIGTLNNIAQFIAMPIAGVVSDRFGRKTMLVGSLTLSAIFGTIRSFTTSYTQFVVFEMLDAMAYSGVYSGIFVFGVEIIGPDKRGVGGAIISIYYSIGEIILGVVVWLVNDWRQYLRILYIPGFIFILYFWILPESIRWLVAHRKREKVTEVFKKMCKLNNRKLDDGLKKAIENLFSSEPQEVKTEVTPIKEEKSRYPLLEVMRSKTMVLRVLNCSFCWITHTFVFYGLSLNSVSIAGNKYLNFILVSFVEIPGYALSWVMIEKLGRKASLFAGLAVSGVACTAFHFAAPDAYVLRLILFLSGKLAITESFTTLYVLASEIYPTDLRHSLLGFCSTLGRVGSMVAPQTPLMEKFMDPLLAFGGISFVAALLGLYFPETKNCTMPDTLRDAENLGKKRKNENSSKETLTP